MGKGRTSVAEYAAANADPVPRYGNTKLTTIRRKVQAHREAVRSGDPVAIEATWDALEPFVDRVFVGGTDER